MIHLYIFIIIILVLYNIYFPNVVYAISPEESNIITDYYQQKEYIGKDPYAYYNNLLPSYLPGIPELEDTSISLPRPSIPELEGDSRFFNRKHVCFELDAMSMDGTASTEVYDKALFDARYRAMVETIENVIHTNVKQPSLFDKVAIVYEQINDNIVFIYLKATEISKRKIYWTIWEKGRGKYESYKEFKKTWDTSTGIWSRLEKSVKSDIEREVKHLLGYNKLKKEMKKSVKREVEKALKNHNPFKI